MNKNLKLAKDRSRVSFSWESLIRIHKLWGNLGGSGFNVGLNKFLKLYIAH